VQSVKITQVNVLNVKMGIDFSVDLAANGVFLLKVQTVEMAVQNVIMPETVLSANQASFKTN
jgi:hypothetical protein